MILKLVQIVSNVFVVAVALAAVFLLIRIACSVFAIIREGRENLRELRKRQQLDAEADTPPEPSPPSWQVVIDDPEADVKKEITADNSSVNELLTRILQQRVAGDFADEPDASQPHFVEVKSPESAESPEVAAALDKPMNERTFQDVSHLSGSAASAAATLDGRCPVVTRNVFTREGVSFDFEGRTFMDLAVQAAGPVADTPNKIDCVPPSDSESPELRAALDTSVADRTDADVVNIVGPDEDNYRPIKASRDSSTPLHLRVAVADAESRSLETRLKAAAAMEAKYGGPWKVLCEDGGGFDRSREDHWLLLQRFARQLRD